MLTNSNNQVLDFKSKLMLNRKELAQKAREDRRIAKFVLRDKKAKYRGILTQAEIQRMLALNSKDITVSESIIMRSKDCIKRWKEFEKSPTEISEFEVLAAKDNIRGYYNLISAEKAKIKFASELQKKLKALR